MHGKAPRSFKVGRKQKKCEQKLRIKNKNPFNKMEN